MMSEVKKIFLLRAFGDFVIALYMASKSKNQSLVTLVASKHLEPLYTSLRVTLPENITIQFHDFKISNNILGVFTDRFLFRLHSITELLALRNYIRNNPIRGSYYMEQRKRIFLPKLFTTFLLKYIVSDQNVYKAYADFFSVDINQIEDFFFPQQEKKMNILIIPETRQKKKDIENGIIEKIIAQYIAEDVTITIAYFKKEKYSPGKNTAVYNNFSELITLIKKSDLLIGGDSLPVHIAQMLAKPHYILYSKTLKDQFFTPFSHRNRAYFAFEDIAARINFLPDE